MPIQVLPPQLANQIAAGEVVERPASVVKELVENSLDAGATRIDIDIERGGSKLIRIRDNGKGIPKDELALALARHATSKIATLDDLEAILSLGFRGEALASISSVSRLTLTSRTADQNEAWQVYAEGRDMSATIKPAAHPVGSTVEVLDLFYNTPARRKFLRTEKTEFGHIDEVIRRIALARFDASINLQHNGKIVRQYRAVKESEPKERRLGTICGPLFLQHALTVDWRHDDLVISGWVADPAGARQLGELQYCYVNGRMMRDRLLNHAIRQAYQAQLNDDQAPAYVLYLDVDPHQVDVNVHPAKHEVRFHQARLVHDFIYQAVITVLQQVSSPNLALSPSCNQKGELTETLASGLPVNRAAAGENKYQRSAEYRSGEPRMAGIKPAYQARDSASPAQIAKESAIYQNMLMSVVDSEDRPSLFPPRESLAREPLSQTDILRPVLFPTPAVTLSKRLDQRSVEQSESGKNRPVSALTATPIYGFGRVLAIWEGHYVISEQPNGLTLINLAMAERYLRHAQLLPDRDGLKPQPLLIPLSLTLSDAECAGFEQNQSLLKRFGFELSVERQRAQLRSVCLPLRQQNMQELLPNLLRFLSDRQQIEESDVANWLASQLTKERQNWTQSQAIQLLADIERLCPSLMCALPTNLIQPIDLKSALSALNYEQ